MVVWRYCIYLVVQKSIFAQWFTTEDIVVPPHQKTQWRAASKSRTDNVTNTSEGRTEPNQKRRIKKYNFDQMGLAEQTLQTEHASSKLRGKFTTDVVVWQLLWLLLTKILLQHKRSCENSEASVVLPAGVPVNVYMKTDIDNTFKNEILARLLPDEVERLCTSDETILAFGQYLFQKIKTKEDKKTEVRRSVMSDMRRLGFLF